MIITLKPRALESDVRKLTKYVASKAEVAKPVTLRRQKLLLTSSKTALDPKRVKSFAASSSVTDTGTEYQLCTRAFQPNNTVIKLASDITFGTNQTVFIAGPCAVESKQQLQTAAKYLIKKHKVKLFRAGAFKPRTSTYTFQGLEDEGLKLLREVREQFGVSIISEVKDTTHFDQVADTTDIIQVGTKAMYNFSLLKKCGQSGKPVMLKRGFMATIKEFLQAADAIMAEGNPNVILCERGIRTFEPQTRFSLDVCAAALVREISHLPIVLDPSHAMGIAAQVPLIAQAAAAMDVDGLMVEVHPNPDQALSDKEQALSFAQVDKMIPRLRKITKAVGRTLT